MKRALFLDRDGTVMEDRGYMCDPALVQLLPGAADALRAISRDGWALIVVSNQSGVGRGLITPAEMEAVQSRFIEAMRNEGVEFTASYFCVHRPEENCVCRKPSPFHVEQAAKDFGIDLTGSWVIGDRQSDILCGRNAACRTIWLRNKSFPVVEGLADFVAADWAEARQVLLQDTEAGQNVLRRTQPV